MALPWWLFLFNPREASPDAMVGMSSRQNVSPLSRNHTPLSCDCKMSQLEQCQHHSLQVEGHRVCVPDINIIWPPSLSTLCPGHLECSQVILFLRLELCLAAQNMLNRCPALQPLRGHQPDVHSALGRTLYPWNLCIPSLWLPHLVLILILRANSGGLLQE